MIERAIFRAMARQVVHGDYETECVLLDAKHEIDRYRDALEFIRKLGLTAAQDPGSALRKATEVAENALMGRPVV